MNLEITAQDGELLVMNRRYRRESLGEPPTQYVELSYTAPISDYDDVRTYACRFEISLAEFKTLNWRPLFVSGYAVRQ